jgi:hypothetical protein
MRERATNIRPAQLEDSANQLPQWPPLSAEPFFEQPILRLEKLNYEHLMPLDPGRQNHSRNASNGAWIPFHQSLRPSFE